MSRIAAILLSLFLFATLARAQAPAFGNVLFGYSYYNPNLSNISRSHLSGWEGSLEGTIFPAIGILADPQWPSRLAELAEPREQLCTRSYVPSVECQHAHL
jgi:hypothetical protein